MLASFLGIRLSGAVKQELHRTATGLAMSSSELGRIAILDAIEQAHAALGDPSYIARMIEKARRERALEQKAA